MTMPAPIVPEDMPSKIPGVTKVSWTTSSLARITASQVVAVVASSAEQKLRFEPERIIRAAYGCSQANIGPTVVELALLPWARWLRVPAFVECATPIGPRASESGIHVSWMSVHFAGVFPIMQADLAVRAVAEGAEILLNGSYEPPLGTFGVLFDRLIGRWVATAVAKHFVASLSASINLDAERSPLAGHTPLRLLEASDPT
jgi:hypothetical protein